MKKTLLILSAAFTLLLYVASCTKDKADPPTDIDCTTVDQTSNTYNLKVKSILDVNCAVAGCHDPLFISSGVNLSNYAGAKTAFQSQEALCTIQQSSGCSPMPKGAPKLADSLITYIQCWTQNNYPQ